MNFRTHQFNIWSLIGECVSGLTSVDPQNAWDRLGDLWDQRICVLFPNETQKLHFIKQLLLTPVNRLPISKDSILEALKQISKPIQKSRQSFIGAIVDIIETIGVFRGGLCTSCGEGNLFWFQDSKSSSLISECNACYRLATQDGNNLSGTNGVCPATRDSLVASGIASESIFFL